MLAFTHPVTALARTALRVRAAAPAFLRPSSSPFFVSPRSPLSLRSYSTAKDADAAAAAAPDAPVEGVNAEVAALTAQLEEKAKLIAELKVRPSPRPLLPPHSHLPPQDARLRALADFENLQKISTREKANAKDFALTSFARDLVASIDILNLALNSVPAPRIALNADLVQLHQGVTMTKKEIERVLKRHGVVAFDPTGEAFDPNKHDALYQAPVPGKEPGSVLECQEIGCEYMLLGVTVGFEDEADESGQT